MSRRAAAIAAVLTAAVLIAAPALTGAAGDRLCSSRPGHCANTTIMTCDCGHHIDSDAAIPGVVPTVPAGATFAVVAADDVSDRSLVTTAAAIAAPAPPGFVRLHRHLLFSVLLI
jgi:hypothetical protein